MYYINKIVGFLVSPIGGAIAGGIVAVVCARLGRKRMAQWIGGLTVAWLWLWMTPIMTWVVGVPLEREFLVDGRVPAVETFPDADAIILLGGGMGADTNHNSYAEMSAGADRVWQAARLHKAGKASKIIATGDYAKDTTLPDARTTEEEAKGLRGAFQRRGAETQSPQSGVKPKILLVTSAWHMKRARLMFEKYAPGIEVVCAPADFENTFTAEKTPLYKMLLPDPNVFMLNSVAFHEWVGIVGYRVFR